MEDTFLLPLTYHDEELEFETKLLMYGYIHRFEVNINGLAVQFEPDEERNYRAMISPEQMEGKGSKLSISLLQAIAERLKELHT